MVMADKESVDEVELIEIEEDENAQHQHNHQCNHQNSNSNNISHLASPNDGCLISEPRYHPWDQDHIVYVPMIPFGDISTRAGVCIQVAGLQPVAPPGEEMELIDERPTINQEVGSTVEAAAAAAAANDAGDEGGGHNQESSPQRLPVSSREMHNEIERKRRLRIKQCCDILRRLIPGLNEKTDKATVLEHAVDYVDHLFNCPNHKCVCYQNK